MAEIADGPRRQTLSPSSLPPSQSAWLCSLLCLPPSRLLPQTASGTGGTECGFVRQADTAKGSGAPAPHAAVGGRACAERNVTLPCRWGHCRTSAPRRGSAHRGSGLVCDGARGGWQARGPDAPRFPRGAASNGRRGGRKRTGRANRDCRARSASVSIKTRCPPPPNTHTHTMSCSDLELGAGLSGGKT